MDLSKIEKPQRRSLRATFFNKKFDSLHDILKTKEILTVFELFIVENIKERFGQLRLKPPKSFIVLDVNGLGTYTYNSM